MNGRVLIHHGIKGQQWGVRLGPPYPLSGRAAGVRDLMKDLSKIRYKEFTSLMSPEMVQKQKRGSCHDQTYYEAAKLREIGVDPKINFFIESDKQNHGGTTHTCVSFELNGKVYWMENAWGGMEGLRGYSSQRQFKKDVANHWEKSPQYPFLYSGSIEYERLKPGMSLEEILDVVDFD